MMEMYLQFQSDSGLLTDTSALRQWSMAYSSSMNRTNVPEGRKDRHAPKMLDVMMTNAGFVNVQMTVRKIPMSPWPEGE